MEKMFLSNAEDIWKFFYILFIDLQGYEKDYNKFSKAAMKRRFITYVLDYNPYNKDKFIRLGIDVPLKKTLKITQIYQDTVNYVFHSPND
jgi:hypothetical protein